MQNDQRVFINCGSEMEAKRLDELLWTFSQGSFVPHKVFEDFSDATVLEPVLIGCGREPGGEQWDLMINLADDVPDFFSRYERVAELVDGEQQRRERGRERYRFYRDRGYELNTHKL
jgi:DNA polymerase-3 subunit chi